MRTERHEIAIQGATVVTMIAPEDVLEDATVTIDDGRFTYVGPRASVSARRTLDGRGRVLLPGLVNCHSHCRPGRALGDAMPLADWHRLYPDGLCQGMAESDARLGGLLAFGESLLGGVTSMVTMVCRPSGALAAADESGIRAVVTPLGAGQSGLENDVLPEMLALARREARRGERARVRFWFGWDHMRTFTEEELRQLGAVAAELGIGIHGHMSELKWEPEWSRKSFGVELAVYLERCGVLGPRTLMAHCIWIDESEMALLARSGTSVVHNPTSNMKFGVGVADVLGLGRAGVTVALGTDGMLSNFHLDMWEVMRGACMLQRVARLDPHALSSWDALTMATKNGAKAIGLERELGTIEVGRLADAILLDVTGLRFQPRSRGRHDNLLAMLVWCARGSDVETVIVDGRVVVDGRRLTTIDERSLGESVNAANARLLAVVDSGDSRHEPDARPGGAPR